MITENYCSFEVAKLLKEKGFDTFKSYGWDEELFDKEHPRNFSLAFDSKEHWISCPTHQMAIAWLREAHGIFILIKPCDSYFDEEYEFSIYKKQNTVIFEWELLEIENSLYEGYEETVEAALKYVLENLI